MQKKNSRWRICTGRNFKLCKNINEVLSQINCSSEKQYSSCQTIVQGWLSGVQKYHDTLTAYKIKIDEQYYLYLAFNFINISKLPFLRLRTIYLYSLLDC